MRQVLALLAAVATLSACSGDSDNSATPTSSSTAPAPLVETDDRDVTGDITAGGQPWTALVTTATQTEPDRVEVETSITDPRGDAGSPAAQQALAVCDGAVAWLQSTGVTGPKVSVLETDGTTFVLAGHPTYGPACTEV